MKEKLKKAYHFSGTWTGTIIIVLFVIFFVIQAFVIPSGSMQRSLLIGDFLFAKKFSYGIPIPRLPFTNTPLFPDIKGNGHLFEGSRPERGDIVIFINPKNDRENYVKRAFATSGDEVIFRNGEFYLHYKEGDEYIKSNFKEEKIVSLIGKLWVKNPYMDEFPGISYIDGADTIASMLMYERHPSGRSLGMSKIMLSGFEPYEGYNFNAFYTKVADDEYFMIGDNRDNSVDSRFLGAIPYKLIIGKPWFIYFSWDDNRNPRWDRIGSLVSTVEKKVNPNYK
ncbi:MAG: signal peptidase I [Campylobacteraceae bacterium]